MKVCSLCRRCCDDSVSSCTEGHPPLSELRSGSCEMIPGYRLEELLESGLKGESYRAREKVSGRTCLIKLLPADVTNREQFLYEARLAAAIFHPNVADIYEADSLQSGELYVVAEDPEGETAREILEKGSRVPLLNAIRIVRQAAEAVHALHLKGLIHRAINPENITVTTDPSGEIVVRLQNPDFGGFAERSIVSNKFLIDTALGSLRYFAPEQCSGEPESIKTDIYALGVVLYEMIAGVPPFDAAKGAALIQMHRSLPPPEIRIDNFDLRMLLTHTLMESLQKHGRTRQSSANAFARQLRHMEQLATHVSTPPPAGVVPEPPPRPAATIAAAVAATTAIPNPVVPTPISGYAEAVQQITARVESVPAPSAPQPLRPALIDFDPVAPIPVSAPSPEPLPVIDESEPSIAARGLESSPALIEPLQGPLDDIPDMPDFLDDIPDMPDFLDDIPDMPDSLDDIPDMPDTLADAVRLEEAIDEAIPTPTAEFVTPEPETIQPEPPQIVIPPLPAVEAVAEEAVKAETMVPEPVPVETELPELPVADELPELSIAPPEPQLAEPVYARATPEKVVWDGLEDDIPSEEDVQAALLEEQPLEEQLPQPAAEQLIPEPIQVEAKPPEMPVIQLEPQVIRAVPIRPAPLKVVCEDLDDDIPSEADVQAALSEDEEPPQPIAIPQPEHEAPRAYLFEEKARPAIVPEVIAVTEPVKRAERRKPVYQPADDQIFAAYGGRSWPAVNVDYRSVLIGVGVITMAVLFFVGRVIMSESFADQGPMKTAEAETIKGQQPPPAHPQQNVVTPDREIGSKSYESTPPADDDLDARQLKPLPSDEGVRPQRQMFFPTPSAKPVERDLSASTSEVTPRVQPPPPPAAVAKNTGKPLPFSPSVVIPYKGPQRAKTSSEKDCADQQTAPVQNRTSSTRAANITRPRVVRDPQN